MKMFFYRIYQLFIMAPVLLVLTILTALVTLVGCLLGMGRFFGYYPAHWWARAFCFFTMVKVEVRGRANISKNTSYVFVANHQGAYDIFSIYGFLNHQFRWLMKKSLIRIPLVGYSCKVAGHVYVDNSSPSAVRTTMETAKNQLSHGMSVVVFPEGSRTADGKMHSFRRGAFALAAEFGMPVVPITIDGSYAVMDKDSKVPDFGKITLSIHEPIQPGDDGKHDLAVLMEASYNAIASSLP